MSGGWQPWPDDLDAEFVATPYQDIRQAYQSPLPDKRVYFDLTVTDPITDRMVALIRERESEKSRPVFAAIALSRDLETCCALLRGESVPRENLDTRWLHLLGQWTD